MDGKEWDRRKIGSRTPVEPFTNPGPEFADLANGDFVPRCWVCGMPGTASAIHDYALVLDGLPYGKWRICDRCRHDRNPNISDPLDVSRQSVA